MQPNDIDTPPQGSRRVQHLIARTQERREAERAKRVLAFGYMLDGPFSDVMEAQLEEFAEREGFDLIRIVTDLAPAVSGTWGSRPGFRHVLDAAKAGRFGTLLIVQTSDLTDDAFEATRLTGVLEDHDVVLRSATEPGVDTSTTAGTMLFAVAAGGR